jgi:hypothetical protein
MIICSVSGGKFPAKFLCSGKFGAWRAVFKGFSSADIFGAEILVLAAVSFS